MEEYLTGYVFKITKLIENIQLHFNEDTMERLPTVKGFVFIGMHDISATISVSDDKCPFFCYRLSAQ